MKQFRLCLEALAVDEACDADAHQPVSRARRQIHAFAQCTGDFSQLMRGGRPFRWRHGAGQDAEVGGLEFQHHAARDASVRVRSLALVRGPGFLGEPLDMGREFVEREVMLESVFG